MISALILMIVAVQQQGSTTQDDIEYSFYGWLGDFAAAHHVGVLRDHYNLDWTLYTPFPIHVRKRQVEADVLWSHVESTGLPIVLYGDGRTSQTARDEPTENKFTWNGQRLIAENGGLFPFDGSMLVEVIARSGEKIEPGDEIAIEWSARRYMKSFGVWSDSIRLELIVHRLRYVFEINDGATSGRVYCDFSYFSPGPMTPEVEKIIENFGKDPFTLRLTPTGWKNES